MCRCLRTLAALTLVLTTFAASLGAPVADAGHHRAPLHVPPSTQGEQTDSESDATGELIDRLQGISPAALLRALADEPWSDAEFPDFFRSPATTENSQTVRHRDGSEFPELLYGAATILAATGSDGPGHGFEYRIFADELRAQISFEEVVSDEIGWGAVVTDEVISGLPAKSIVRRDESQSYAATLVRVGNVWVFNAWCELCGPSTSPARRRGPGRGGRAPG